MIMIVSVGMIGMQRGDTTMHQITKQNLKHGALRAPREQGWIGLSG
jgi:hypothetical protein